MGHSHFLGLNYTLANEDTRFELGVLENEVGHVLSIAGSGSRVIPLLSKRPKRLTCVDLSQEQLNLTELRVESVRSLSHSEYLAFWGYPSDFKMEVRPEMRQHLFEKISGLGPEARKYFKSYFQKTGWSSLLYQGKYERTAKKISQVIRLCIGKKGLRLFQFSSLPEQRAYLKSEFPVIRWNAFIFLYSQLLALIWRLNPGRFPNKNIKTSFYEIYKGSFDRMFQNTLARENFLLQLLFFGELIDPKACLLETQPEIFAAAKKALEVTQVSYSKKDVLHLMPEICPSVDYVSISNAPSYFSGDLNTKYLEKMVDGLSKGALIIVRNFLHSPKLLRLNGFKELTGSFEKLALSEKTQSYDIRVYQYTGEFTEQCSDNALAVSNRSEVF